MSVAWSLACVDCATRYGGLEVRYRCDCGGTLDVVHDLEGKVGRRTFDERRASSLAVDRSGVWRFRELILPVPIDEIVTRPEGNTNLYDNPHVANYVGVDSLLLKHEGENPTGSFKDRGMTVGITIARKLGIKRVACASTGNTSASMAAYASMAGMSAFVFVPEGRIAHAKLAQALAYGARTIQLEGDFDVAMKLVEEVCRTESIYLLNSVNPFRIEGQKAIVFELLQDLEWKVPDWLVIPGGNLGNSSALYRGLEILRDLGLIPRIPRIAVIQAEGANPLYTAFTSNKDLQPVSNARTLATAIRIGNPVSWKKSLRGVKESDGTVEQVSDQEIMDAKAQVDRAGIGAEPASCATVAGARKLVAQGVIGKRDLVCGILTGHLLKDPDLTVDYHRDAVPGVSATYANKPIPCKADLESVRRLILSGS